MPTDSTVPPAAASGLRMIDRAALQALLDTTVADELVPGAVVLLRRPQGEVTAAAGTVERGVERPPDIDTHFRIASNTKTMTAAVIMQLAHEGKLQLDDPVSTYVADVPDGGRITIDQLLKMRSGLYNYTNSPTLTTTLDDDPTKVWTPPELLAIAFAQPPSSAPGAGYEYNNTNYVLLGLIIEKAGGRSLDTAFRERLFEPLGMHDTELPAGDSNHIPDPFARGYMYGSSSVAMYDSPVYTPEQVAAAEAGTLEPKDYTDVNHSFAWAPGGVRRPPGTSPRGSKRWWAAGCWTPLPSGCGSTARSGGIPPTRWVCRTATASSARRSDPTHSSSTRVRPSGTTRRCSAMRATT
jgi:D-alanyl-D-alanine carboxypeptidase